MKCTQLLSWVFISTLLLASTCSAEEQYLVNACESIIPADFISSMTISDVEAKNTWNILVGTSYNGVLYNFVYDRNTDCNVEWAAESSFNTGGYIKEIVVKDADKDGKKDIIINGAKSKKEKNPDFNVYVLDMQNNALLERWRFKEECGLSNSVDSYDLYSTGEGAIIIGTESGKVCTMDEWSTNRKQLMWSSQALGNPIVYIYATDFNKDGSPDVLALTSRRYDATLYLLDKDGKVQWQREIDGGVRTIESMNIGVSDLDGDGKKEIIVGTQDHGVDVYDSNGNLLWNYDTKSGSDSDIVTKVATYSFFTDDKELKIVAAAKPYIYLLDNKGNLVWRAEVNTTVFDFGYGDVDKDGRNELVAGATSYIYIYGDDGTLEGTWSYVNEIQGMTGVYTKRDMDTVKLRVSDLDLDGRPEIVAAFKWFDDQLDNNVAQGSIRVFEVNEKYKPPTTTTTTEAATATSQASTVTTLPPVISRPTTTLSDGDGGLCPCLPLLPAVLALIAAIAVGLPLAARS